MSLLNKFSNRKNLFVLLLTLVCVDANNAWGIEYMDETTLTAIKAGLRYLLDPESTTAFVRTLAISGNQFYKNKCGPDSKAALISGLVANFARLANDSTSLYNRWGQRLEYNKIYNDTTHAKSMDSGEKVSLCTDAVSILPMLLDIIDACIKVKKLYNKDFAPKKQQTPTKKNPKETKLLFNLNTTALYIECLAAFIRAGAKWPSFRDQLENPINHNYLIQLSTAALIFARVAEFYIHTDLTDSSKIKAIICCTLAIAAIVGIATDFGVMFKKS